MDKLLEFLKSQKMMTVASSNLDDLWITNVFYSVDDDLSVYFISPGDAKHSKQIKKNSKIAFSVSWFDPKNTANRKAVQGTGICVQAGTPEKIARGIYLHNKNFPEFKKRITPTWINSESHDNSVWVIKPNYMKYWDDEKYLEKESEEFILK